MTLQHSYVADGTSISFAFSFPIEQEGDIQVKIDGVEQLSGYTVRGGANPGGGAVTFLAPPSSGQSILIRHRGRLSVSSTDASFGYLSDKLVAGGGIALSTLSDGEGRQSLEIASTISALDPANNLSDVANAEQARHNLGLDNVAYLNVAQDWVQPQRNRVLLTEAEAGGSMALDMELYQNFELTLTADLTLANPVMTTALGQRGTITIIPGSFAIVAMGDQWKRAGDTGAPSEIIGVGRIDYHVRSTNRIEYAYTDVEA